MAVRSEVRTYLTDWANYRYTISRDTIAKKYPLNYYFLSQPLASQLMAADNHNRMVSQVIGGQILEVRDLKPRPAISRISSPRRRKVGTVLGKTAKLKKFQTG